MQETFDQLRATPVRRFRLPGMALLPFCMA